MQSPNARQIAPGHTRIVDADPRLPHREAAAYLGISPHTLVNWRASGRADRRIPFVKVGAKVFYRQSALEAFLAKNTFDFAA